MKQGGGLWGAATQKARLCSAARLSLSPLPITELLRVDLCLPGCSANGSSVHNVHFHNMGLWRFPASAQLHEETRAAVICRRGASAADLSLPHRACVGAGTARGTSKEPFLPLLPCRIAPRFANRLPETDGAGERVGSRVMQPRAREAAGLLNNL